MSTALRQFLARLAIDPEAYGRFLGDPTQVALEDGLSEKDLALLREADQHQLYRALTGESASEGEAS